VSAGPQVEEWAIGGSDGEDWTQLQYAIEPDRGCDARNHSDDLCTQIEDLPNYRDGARIISRTVTYGPWFYVSDEELNS
jgi:hypothetical protein